MPIVIEEMTIQVVVSSDSKGNTAAPGETNTAGTETNKKAALIKACLDEVMEVIRHQKER